MGMYDMVTVSVPCPFCGSVITDGQTKDLENMMDSYNIGSPIHDDRLRYIRVLYDCKNSLKCLSKSIRYHSGSFHGFGVIFDVKIAVIYDKLSNYYFDIEPSKHYVTDESDSEAEALEYFASSLDAYHIDDLLLCLSEKDLDTLKTYLDKTYGCV